MSLGAIVARVAVGASLIAAGALCVYGILFWPWVLIFLAAGLVLGLVVRLFIRRRPSRQQGAMAAQHQEAPNDDAAVTVAPRRRGLALLGVVAAVVFVAIFASYNAQLESLKPPGARQPQERALRVHYEADLNYDTHGDWKGSETFDFSKADARRLVGGSSKGLDQRLADAVPLGWEVAPDEIGGKLVYHVQREFPSRPFAVPRWRPLTVTTTLPPPELRSERFALPVFAAAKSTVTLHAPEARIHATTPPGKHEPEGEANDLWTIPLKVLGKQRAGSDAKIDVKSNLATYLPEELVGRTFAAVVAGLLTTVGFSIVGLPTLVGKLFRWLLLARRSQQQPPASASVLRGATTRQAALEAYLEKRGLGEGAIQAETDAALHDARRLARRALDVAGTGETLKAYNAALSRLQAENVPPLDAIYRALAEVGIADSELRIMDRDLDELIAKSDR